MKKLSVMVLLLMLVVGGMVYAQETRPPRVQDLSEEQVAELESIWSQMAELQEQVMDKMVEFGVISQERADWMKQGRELRQSEGFGRGAAYCHDEDFQGRAGRFGRGMMGGGMMGWR